VRREFVHFETRQDRPRFIGRRFAPYLGGRVLDVGCDRAVLREVVGPSRYVGVDVSEEADVHLDLDRTERLPFEDRAFDSVVSLDCLEHLDGLHRMFDECVRLSRRFVVVSLPNNWSGARKRLRRGHGSFLHYGLPVEPPLDRHKWFFNTEEASAFLDGQAKRHGLEIRELVALEKPRPVWNRAWRLLQHPSRRAYLNLYPHTLVCVYEKRP